MAQLLGEKRERDEAVEDISIKKTKTEQEEEDKPILDVADLEYPKEDEEDDEDYKPDAVGEGQEGGEDDDEDDDDSEEDGDEEKDDLEAELDDADIEDAIPEGYDVDPEALKALKSISREFLTEVFRNANLIATVIGKRDHLTSEDMSVAVEIMTRTRTLGHPEDGEAEEVAA